MMGDYPMISKIYSISIIVFIFLISMGAGVAQTTAEDDHISFDISHHHVGISVADAEETAVWYKRMFGFNVIARINQSGMKVVHIQRGDCYIELFQVEGAKPLPEYRRDPTKDLGVHGTVHFAFKVADVKAAIKEVRAKGAEIAMEPIETPGIVFAFVRDNSGNCFELIQYKNQK
jgi:catechol 2,3-dioxygenase-like lactoylglutathione lyase family enzyme